MTSFYNRFGMNRYEQRSREKFQAKKLDGRTEEQKLQDKMMQEGLQKIAELVRQQAGKTPNVADVLRAVATIYEFDLKNFEPEAFRNELRRAMIEGRMQARLAARRTDIGTTPNGRIMVVVGDGVGRAGHFGLNPDMIIIDDPLGEKFHAEFQQEMRWKPGEEGDGGNDK